MSLATGAPVPMRVSNNRAGATGVKRLGSGVGIGAKVYRRDNQGVIPAWVQVVGFWHTVASEGVLLAA